MSEDPVPLEKICDRRNLGYPTSHQRQTILDLQSMETRSQNAKNELSFVYFVCSGCLLLICFSRRKSQICSLLILSMHSRSSWERSKHNSFVNNRVMYAAGGTHGKQRTYFQIPAPQLPQLPWLHPKWSECDPEQSVTLPAQQVMHPPL